MRRPGNRHLAARVRAFVDWVSEVFADECREAARIAGVIDDP